MLRWRPRVLAGAPLAANLGVPCRIPGMRAESLQLVGPGLVGVAPLRLNPKPCPLRPAPKAAESLQLVGPGTVVVADNVLYPGAPGFLEYLDASGHYSTTLAMARYEYDQVRTGVARPARCWELCVEERGRGGHGRWDLLATGHRHGPASLGRKP